MNSGLIYTREELELLLSRLSDRQLCGKVHEWLWKQLRLGVNWSMEDIRCFPVQMFAQMPRHPTYEDVLIQFPISEMPLYLYPDGVYHYQLVMQIIAKWRLEIGK